MAGTQITVEELAEFMQRQLPLTYNLFDENRHEDSQVNTASWARGRIDAFLQIMAIIDKDREAMLRADWVRVVTGKGFMEGDDEA
ncbi:hypothetical protein [Blastococcus tunisiensis]|uniref:Uncharacterized protein n=1 Tax=Blastococcus tunisiensis TaxID=1798228 RepID=A0A1I2KIK7_9ACTN|nr:hypothetical protein [Blastococcus sp. DSM 46838]SFF66794.1 hypothetical protein SAMN05216574_1226 [Blastococcus sp. DSM 46838]